MQTLIATILIFAVAMTAMAVGVIVSDRRLRGSCGATGLDCTCDAAAREDCDLAKHAKRESRSA
jgi:hypothetical protein